MTSNLYIGDSHIRCMQVCSNYTDQIIELSATSARGLNNPHSKSQSGIAMLEFIKVNKFKKIFMMFGKVDMDWVLPYKSLKSPINVDEYINEVVNEYINFITLMKTILAQLCANTEIFVLGIHLPCLESELMIKVLNRQDSINTVTDKNDLLEKDYHFTTLEPLKDRIIYTLKFNSLLKEKIANYLDISQEIMESEGVNSFLLNDKYIFDHHLDNTKAGWIWRAKYYKIFKNE